MPLFEGRLRINAASGILSVATSEGRLLFGTVSAATAPLRSGDRVEGSFVMKPERDGSSEDEESGDEGDDSREALGDGEPETEAGPSGSSGLSDPTRPPEETPSEGSSGRSRSSDVWASEEGRLRSERGWVTRLWPLGYPPPVRVPERYAHSAVLQRAGQAMEVWAAASGCPMWPSKPQGWVHWNAQRRGFGSQRTASFFIGTPSGPELVEVELSFPGVLDEQAAEALAKKAGHVFYQAFRRSDKPVEDVFQLAQRSIHSRQSWLNLLKEFLVGFAKAHADQGSLGRRLVKVATKYNRLITAHVIALSQVRRWRLKNTGEAFLRRELQLCVDLVHFLAGARKKTGLRPSLQAGELHDLAKAVVKPPSASLAAARPSLMREEREREDSPGSVDEEDAELAEELSRVRKSRLSSDVPTRRLSWRQVLAAAPHSSDEDDDWHPPKPKASGAPSSGPPGHSATKQRSRAPAEEAAEEAGLRSQAANGAEEAAAAETGAEEASAAAPSSSGHSGSAEAAGQDPVGAGQDASDPTPTPTASAPLPKRKRKRGFLPPPVKRAKKKAKKREAAKSLS